MIWPIQTPNAGKSLFKRGTYTGLIKLQAGRRGSRHSGLGGEHPMAASAVWRYLRNVRHRSHDQALLLSRLKRFMAEMFRPDILVSDKIPDDEPLTGAIFGIDSLDMLELAICLEEEFGIAIRREEESRIILGSIASLADCIRERTEIGQARLPASRYFASGEVRMRQVGPIAQRSAA
jgi:acyl carrier protein